MMNDQEQQGADLTPQAKAAAAASTPDAGGPRWEADLDVYPIRPADQDPRWALWVFWIWVSFTVFSLVAMTVLSVLGWYYD